MHCACGCPAWQNTGQGLSPNGDETATNGAETAVLRAVPFSQDFKGLPQLFRDLMMELKQWMSLDNLFAAENQAEKVCLMRQAWDMGKDPLVIMRSSPHAVSCRPQPLVDVTLYADSETLYAVSCDPHHSWRPTSGDHLSVSREQCGLLMHVPCELKARVTAD